MRHTRALQPLMRQLLRHMAIFNDHGVFTSSRQLQQRAQANKSDRKARRSRGGFSPFSCPSCSLAPFAAVMNKLANKEPSVVPTSQHKCDIFQCALTNAAVRGPISANTFRSHLSTVGNWGLNIGNALLVRAVCHLLLTLLYNMAEISFSIALTNESIVKMFVVVNSCHVTDYRLRVCLCSSWFPTFMANT